MALATREASRGVRLEVTRGQTPTPPNSGRGGRIPQSGGTERYKLARGHSYTRQERGQSSLHPDTQGPWEGHAHPHPHSLPCCRATKLSFQSAILEDLAPTLCSSLRSL